MNINEGFPTKDAVSSAKELGLGHNFLQPIFF